MMSSTRFPEGTRVRLLRACIAHLDDGSTFPLVSGDVGTVAAETATGVTDTVRVHVKGTSLLLNINVLHLEVLPKPETPVPAPPMKPQPNEDQKTLLRVFKILKEHPTNAKKLSYGEDGYVAAVRYAYLEAKDRLLTLNLIETE